MCNIVGQQLTRLIRHASLGFTHAAVSDLNKANKL
jgi:hypothetical protein